MVRETCILTVHQIVFFMFKIKLLIFIHKSSTILYFTSDEVLCCSLILHDALALTVYQIFILMGEKLLVLRIRLVVEPVRLLVSGCV